MKILIFSDGSKVSVVKDGGKFWITEKAQYRKNNPDIVEVATVKEEKKEENKADNKEENKEIKKNENKPEKESKKPVSSKEKGE